MTRKPFNLVSIDDCEWKSETGPWGSGKEAVVFEGDYGVRVGIYNVPPGFHIPAHTHTTWAAFTVLKGRMKIELEDGGTFEITAGSAYFIHPGQQHIETALEETTSVVVYDPKLEITYL